MQEGWVPWSTETTAYTWRHYELDLKHVQQRCSATTSGSRRQCTVLDEQRAWQGLDVPLSIQRQATSTPGSPPLSGSLSGDEAWIRDAHLSWHPMSYELLVVPSHFVATHRLARQLAAKTLVIPGLNSREVTPIKWAEWDKVQPWEECSRLWLGPEHAWRLAEINARPRMKRTNKAPITIAYVGRIVREKGIGQFIRAVAQVRDLLHDAGQRLNTTEVRFVVIGGPSTPGYMTNMRELAEKLRVQTIIDFVGFAAPAQLMTWYKHRCISAIVAPYVRPLSETFGLVLTEAMAAEVPVIHFGVGGIQDYARLDRNSLAPANVSAEGLAELLWTVMRKENRHALRALGAEASAFVRAALRKEWNAWHLHTVLRAERAASLLLHRHIVGGFASEVAAGRSSPDGFASCPVSGDGSPAARALTWAALLQQDQGAASPSTPAHGSFACTGDYPPSAAPGSLIISAALLPASPLAQRLDNRSRFLVSLRVSRIEHGASSSALNAATRLLPGFEDVLCASSSASSVASTRAERPEIADVSCASINKNIQALYRDRIPRTTALCWSWQIAGAESVEECTHTMDLVPDSTDMPVSVDGTLYDFLVEAPAHVKRVRFALVDVRLPHAVLAHGLCVS